MKGYITVLLFTTTQLPLIKNIHRVRETVVRVFEFLVGVPAVRLIRGFGASQWRYARTVMKMLFAKGVSRKRFLGTLRETLTLVLVTGFMKVCTPSIFGSNFSSL